MAGDEPLSAEDFLRRAASKRAVAAAFMDDKRPDKASRPDLHTHDLKALFRIAGIDPTACPPHMRGRLRVVLTWDHGHEYASGTMARRVARDMVVAACGEDGVCSWLLTQ